MPSVLRWHGHLPCWAAQKLRGVDAPRHVNTGGNMSGVLQIWNMALGWVGTRTLAAENENTQEAVQCRLFWDNARRQVLRDFPWNFARRRARLARVSVPEGWEGAFSHAFALPADCLKVLTVLEDDGGQGVPFCHTLAYDPAAARQVLLAGAPRVLLVYSADVRHAELFDDLFTYLLARRLAALVAVPLLRNNTAKVRELEELYRSALPQAREANASETPAAVGRDIWLESRQNPE